MYSVYVFSEVVAMTITPIAATETTTTTTTVKTDVKRRNRGNRLFDVFVDASICLSRRVLEYRRSQVLLELIVGSLFGKKQSRLPRDDVINRREFVVFYISSNATFFS